MASSQPDSSSTNEQARAAQQGQQLDERLAVLHQLIASAPDAARRDYFFKLDISWIHHDSALEGVVYEIPELLRALRVREAADSEAQVTEPVDPALAQAFDEIRQYKQAISLVREMAQRKRLKIDAELLNELHACLAPDEVEGKTEPAYRTDSPTQRLYYHDILAPEAIGPALEQFDQWVNSPETKRTSHPLRLAAKAHFQLMHVYPFTVQSGKAARLVMNLILLANGYPPAIIHSAERQRYYDALKTDDNALSVVVREALLSSMESAIRYFETVAPPPSPAKKPRKSAAARRTK